MEQEFRASVAEACPQSRRSAQNLLHYLALRQHDLRDLQSKLAALGLSSLGRSESNALAGVESVIAILKALAGECCYTPPNPDSVDFKTGPAMLAEQAAQLLGPVPRGREVRVMVTMPSEAAHSYELIRDLVDAGMDVMRVNCAHDSEKEWDAMIRHLRQANEELGKRCRVLMDLAGPKLRTGPIRKGHHIVRWRVPKNATGAIAKPVRIVLASKRAEADALQTEDTVLPVPETLVRAAREGDVVHIRDSRNRKRKLTVTQKSDHACVCTTGQGAYIQSRAEWSLQRSGKKIATGHVGELPFVEEPIRLQRHDLLILTREESKPLARHGEIPHVSCTLPEVFSTAQAGQPIFFDDGKIEGRIREVTPDFLRVEIVHTGAGGAKLGSAKGYQSSRNRSGDRRDDRERPPRSGLCCSSCRHRGTLLCAAPRRCAGVVARTRGPRQKRYGHRAED